MSIRAALLCLSVVFAADAGATSAEDILIESLHGPDVGYEGQIEIATNHGEKTKQHVLSVLYSPPDKYKRVVTDGYGIPVLTIVSDGETEWVYDRRRGTAWKGEPADADYKLLDPDEERDLLLRNYSVTAEGDQTIAGRSCYVLAVRSRQNSTLVRRLWIDKETALVLQRTTFRRDGSEISRMKFLRADIGVDEDGAEFSFAPPAGVRIERNRLRPDFLDFDEAAMATDMKPRVPGWLPAGYLFESLNLLPYKGATILHYRFTDGVDVLSLFQSPRRARIRYSGDEPGGASTEIAVAMAFGKGRVALTPEGKLLEWRQDDHFVLLGRLGVESLKRVAESLVPAGKGKP